MATPIEQRGYARPDVLVSTDWVAQHLNDPNVRIIESNEDTLLYSSGHVPGAVHVDWTADLNDQIRRDYITREGFEALMSRIGATQRHDGRLLRRQEQLVGLLRLLGVPAVRPHQREGHGRRAPEVGEGKARDDPRRPGLSRRRHYTGDGTRRHARIRAFRDEVLAHLKAQGQLVDVRSPEEYTGKRLHMPDYPNEGALRGGHIPGAKSVPWARAINPDDGTFKTSAELKKLYLEDQKLSPDQGRPSPTAASASAAATPGSRSSTCSASATSATTTAAGPSGATW